MNDENTIHIIIEGELTDFNTFDKAARTNKFVAGKIKKEETDRVAWECKKTHHGANLEFPVHISYVWYCKNERKDIDNVAFAKKFINDGLVSAGILPDDSRKYVLGFSDEFPVDKKNPRVEIFIA